MLSTQDIDRILNRLDKIEEGQMKLLESLSKMDQITLNHDRRITNLESRFWWFIGLWVAGAIGLVFYTLQ